LPICMGLQIKRPMMEEWYGRAMAGDPDNLEAVRRKATYLEPKWRGGPSGAAYDEWTRDLTRAKNWDGGFGMACLEEYSTLWLGYQNKQPKAIQYWRQVDRLFQDWLRTVPDCRYAKTLQARAAIQSEQYVLASKLLKELGDKPWPGVFPARDYKKIAEA